MEFIELMIRATERLLPHPLVQREGITSGAGTATPTDARDEVAKPTKDGC